MSSGTGFYVLLSGPAEARFEILTYNTLDSKEVSKDLNRNPCIDSLSVGNYAWFYGGSPVRMIDPLEREAGRDGEPEQDGLLEAES